MTERTSEVLIRDCREADVPAIRGIYAEAVLTGLASFEVEPPDEAEMLRRRAAVLAGGFPYFVAELDGRVAGYAYAGPYRPRPAYRFSVENSIYVDQGAQRHGIGRRLLAHLIAACTERGFRQMIAVIGDSGNDASIRLHAAAGFATIGTLPSIGFKHGRWVDSVLMQRALGDGDRTLPRG
ncbi:GNAT family N-acetyltransferase [Prosthecomicrobium sp. N25]|uniref:GNAT family N-acetyltransferase n=1 Tax=Prosthecomicrobium sp. N25 TaxID=3129254 RepID=UPI0030777C76